MSEKPIRTLNSQFLVHIPKRVEDTIWIGGRELYFDGSYAEHFNKKLGGVVVGMPDRLGAEYLLQRRAYTPKNVPCSDIQDEVIPGDMLYVDWSVSEPHFEVPGLGPVYRATANQVVARVREGLLIPYGSYVFCKEIYPDGVEAVEVAGHTLRLRMSGSGLALGSEEIPPVPYQGEVVHVGLPLRGQPQRVRPGDRVVFDKRVCGKAEGLPLKMKIEGQEYLCIRQDYIEAVLVPEAPRGYNYDPDAIEQFLHKIGYTAAYAFSLRDVVENHHAQLAEQEQGVYHMHFMGVDIIAALVEQGAISQNF
jgi:hypothetical protein